MSTYFIVNERRLNTSCWFANDLLYSTLYNNSTANPRQIEIMEFSSMQLDNRYSVVNNDMKWSQLAYSSKTMRTLHEMSVNVFVAILISEIIVNRWQSKSSLFTCNFLSAAARTKRLQHALAVYWSLRLQHYDDKTLVRVMTLTNLH